MKPFFVRHDFCVSVRSANAPPPPNPRPPPWPGAGAGLAGPVGFVVGFAEAFTVGFTVGLADAAKVAAGEIEVAIATTSADAITSVDDFFMGAIVWPKAVISLWKRQKNKAI
jgi:hypothetical protein